MAALSLQMTQGHHLKQGASKVKETCPDKLQNAKNIEKYQFEGKKKFPSPPGQTVTTRKPAKKKPVSGKIKTFFPTSFKSIISYVQNKSKIG